MKFLCTNLYVPAEYYSHCLEDEEMIFHVTYFATYQIRS